ncbi:MAG: restriction endonuclease subunit S, partial [Cyclobacteriaceae bacterium]|nr:restriction endonuclease subunit S [Cyclobacteriaceae bacterium]
MNIEFSQNSIPIKLIELFDYVIGGDWGKDPSYQDEHYELAYCIRGSEFKNWSEDKGKTASLRKLKKNSITARKLQEGDILIEISGGGPEQPVGRTVLIDKAVLSFRPEIPKVCTNFLRLARPTKFIDSRYLNYFLTFFYKSGNIVLYQGGSNNLRNLKFDDYASIQVPIAPLPEQHRIVAKIEELFS